MSSASIKRSHLVYESGTHNNRMQSDFGKLRLPQPLIRGVMWQVLRKLQQLETTAEQMLRA